MNSKSKMTETSGGLEKTIRIPDERIEKDFEIVQSRNKRKETIKVLTYRDAASGASDRVKSKRPVKPLKMLTRSKEELKQACKNLKLGRREHTETITARLINCNNEVSEWNVSVEGVVEVLARLGVNVDKVIAIDWKKKSYSFKALLGEGMDPETMLRRLRKNDRINKGSCGAPEDLDIQIVELKENKIRVEEEFEVKAEMTYRRVNEWEAIKQVGKFVEVISQETEKLPKEFASLWRTKNPNATVPRGFGLNLKVRGDPMNLPMYIVANEKIVKLTSDKIQKQCHKCMSHYHIVKECIEEEKMSAKDYAKILELYLNNKEWNRFESTKYNQNPETIEKYYQTIFEEPEGNYVDHELNQKNRGGKDRDDRRNNSKIAGEKEDSWKKTKNTNEESNARGVEGKKKNQRRNSVDINKTDKKLVKSQEEGVVNDNNDKNSGMDDDHHIGEGSHPGGGDENKNRTPKGKRQRTESPIFHTKKGRRREGDLEEVREEGGGGGDGGGYLGNEWAEDYQSRDGSVGEESDT